MTKSHGSFFCLGISHQKAPLEYREQISPEPEQLEDLYQELRKEEYLHELAILNTCNRLEVYGTTTDTDSMRLTNCISGVLKTDSNELNNMLVMKWDDEAMEHLFSVTAGLDSQIVGEVEITGQVKHAFQQATDKKTVGKFLNKAFQKSFQTTKWIRTNTNIGKGHINIATVAVDLALKMFGHLRNSTALVIGAGDIAEKTIAALTSRGIKNLVICNRTFEKAEALASATKGTAIPFESLESYLNKSDVVLCSTSSPGFILTASKTGVFLKKRAVRPICMLDLALPRDIDPAIEEFPNAYLYNLDNLAEIADRNLEARKKELENCHKHITKKVHHLMHRPAYWHSSSPQSK